MSLRAAADHQPPWRDAGDIFRQRCSRESFHKSPDRRKIAQPSAPCDIIEIPFVRHTLQLLTCRCWHSSNTIPGCQRVVRLALPHREGPTRDRGWVPEMQDSSQRPTNCGRQIWGKSSPSQRTLGLHEGREHVSRRLGRYHGSPKASMK